VPDGVKTAVAMYALWLPQSLAMTAGSGPPVGIDAFCRKGHYSQLAQYTTWRAGAQHTALPLAVNSNRASVGETGLEPATPGPRDQHLEHYTC
jgi:hypothetical protein